MAEPPMSESPRLKVGSFESTATIPQQLLSPTIGALAPNTSMVAPWGPVDSISDDDVARGLIQFSLYNAIARGCDSPASMPPPSDVFGTLEDGKGSVSFEHVLSLLREEDRAEGRRCRPASLPAEVDAMTREQFVEWATSMKSSA